jgi:integrase/recombinase XerD
MTQPRPDRVRVSGPLLSFAEGFGMQLVEQGYAPCSVQFQLQLLAHLSRWMQAGGVEVGELSPAMVDRFLAERRQSGYASRISLKGMRPLLGYLDRLGELAAAGDVSPTPVDLLVEEFCSYLREERGLVAGFGRALCTDRAPVSAGALRAAG